MQIVCDIGVSIASRTAAGSSSHRSRLSFSPPWLGVVTLTMPSASSSVSRVQPQQPVRETR